MDKNASQQIDDIIEKTADWRGNMLAKLRAVILGANPALIEEVKWKKPSKPEGVAVWVLNGNICVAELLKNAVRLTFPKGAQINDSDKLFNTRLDSKSVRAIDFYADAAVDEDALRALVAAATVVNKR